MYGCVFNSFARENERLLCGAMSAQKQRTEQSILKDIIIISLKEKQHSTKMKQNAKCFE